MQEIIWQSIKKRLNDLKDYDSNPRTITKTAFAKLVESIKQDGYHQRIIIDPNNRIIGGHQRKQAMLAAGWSGEQLIECLQANRELTEEEFKRINIRDNLQHGDWDLDTLANNFDAELLIDWGFDEKLLGIIAEVELPELDDGDKSPFEQITFTLHESQAAIVRAAIDKVKAAGKLPDDVNTNENGNAIFLICREFA